MRQPMDFELVFGADMAECPPLEFRKDPHREAEITLALTAAGERLEGERAIELPRVENHVLLRWEVAKERSPRDARRGRDFVDRDVPERAPCKSSHGRIDDGLSGCGLLLIAEGGHSPDCMECGT